MCEILSYGETVITAERTLSLLDQTGAVLILRTAAASSAERIGHAAIAGGFRVLEIPLTVPDALGAISRLRKEYGDDISVGAGSVLDAERAREAIDAGATVLVTPHVAPQVVATAKAEGLAAISGAFTPTEVVLAHQAGADIVKLFPAELHGPPYLQSLRAPLPHIPICPTGGVTPDNVREWFSAGAAVVGIAGHIARAGGPDLDSALIRTAATDFLGAIADARA